MPEEVTYHQVIVFSKDFCTSELAINEIFPAWIQKVECVRADGNAYAQAFNIPVTDVKPCSFGRGDKRSETLCGNPGTLGSLWLDKIREHGEIVRDPKDTSGYVWSLKDKFFRSGAPSYIG